MLVVTVRFALLLVAVGTLGLLTSSQALGQQHVSGCVTTRENVSECGSGKGAFRLIDGTRSPNGELALAWRDLDSDPGETPDSDTVENHLVRLRDGKSLALVVGRYWEADAGRANHVYVHAAWSPNSSWLLVGDASKWTLEAIAAYPVDVAADSTKAVGLLRLVTAAATRELVKRKGKAASRYLLDIDGGAQLAISNDGVASIPVVFQVPKTDDAVGFLVRIKLTRVAVNQGPRAAVISVDHRKL